MRTVLITSNSLRHKYLAAQLAEGTQLALVVSEEKSAKIQDATSYSEEEAQLLNAHFRSRQESEGRFFGRFDQFPTNTPLLSLPHGEVNTLAVFEQILEKAPDYIILFGSSIIKPPLLENYPGRVVNLHLGLSPYYRGSATNLFPFFYKEPEGVGATIHLATSKVDEGAILAQLRPQIQIEDDVHSIGNGVILEAGKLFPKVLQAWSQNKLIPRPQKEGGRICRNKDFNPSVLRTIQSNFQEGMLEDYLREKEERDRRKPIVQNPACSI